VQLSYDGSKPIDEDSEETRRALIDYYPIWFEAEDLIGVFRNAMRIELSAHGEPLELGWSDCGIVAPCTALGARRAAENSPPEAAGAPGAGAGRVEA
jgi:hypothetical protein